MSSSGPLLSWVKRACFLHFSSLLDSLKVAFFIVYYVIRFLKTHPRIPDKLSEDV